MWQRNATVLVLVAAFTCIHGAKLGKVPGLEDASPETAFKQADVDGNGELSVEEFVASMSSALGSLGDVEKAKMQMYMDMIKEKFAHFDEDKSGSLSPKEWETISLAGQKAAADAQHNQLKRQNNQLKSLFEKADKDNNGKLTAQEMFDGFSQYGYDQKQIQRFFKIGDADKDQTLTFDELLAGRDGMQRAKELEAMMESYKSEDEQIKAFNDADMNGDGKLSLLEYTNAMEEFISAMGSDAKAIDPKQIAESFAQFDTDGDGKVTQEEWIASVQRNIQGKDEL